MAPTRFGLRPSSGSLQLSLAKVILILKHSVKLRLYLLCSGRHRALHTVHTPYWDILPHHRITKFRSNFTECFNINIILARLNCKLPDDGRRPKHVGAI